MLSVQGQVPCWMPINPQALWFLPQVAGRLHVEVMRITGAVPERVVEDDSSENSSEGGSLEVTDISGETVHRVKKLTCRVRGHEMDGCRGMTLFMPNSSVFHRAS